MAERTGAQVNGVAGLIGAVMSNGTDEEVVALARTYQTYQTRAKLTLTQDEIDELCLDPTVKLARKLVLAPAIQAGWSVKAKDDVKEEIRVATEDLFVPMHTHVMTNAILGCIDHGFQPFEKVWRYNPQTKRRELSKLKPLLQTWTDVLVNLDGSYAGLENRAPAPVPNPSGEPVKLDVEETLLLYQDVRGTNWYGQSDLTSTKLVCDKYAVVDAAADRYDAKVTGTHWVLYYPVGRTIYKGIEQDNRDIAIDIMNRIESTGRIILPRNVVDMVHDLNDLAAIKETGWKIEMLSASGLGNADMITRMKYLDSLKVRSLGFPERSILEGQHGTLAEAEAHGNLAALTVNLRRIDITLAVNWHCVNHYLRLNWGPELENKVWLELNPINDISIKFLQSVYQTLLSGSQVSANLQQSLDAKELAERLRVPLLSAAEIAELPKITPEDATSEQQRPAAKPGEKDYVPPAREE